MQRVAAFYRNFGPRKERRAPRSKDREQNSKFASRLLHRLCCRSSSFRLTSTSSRAVQPNAHPRQAQSGIVAFAPLVSVFCAPGFIPMASQTPPQQQEEEEHPEHIQRFGPGNISFVPSRTPQAQRSLRSRSSLKDDKSSIGCEFADDHHVSGLQRQMKREDSHADPSHLPARLTSSPSSDNWTGLHYSSLASAISSLLPSFASTSRAGGCTERGTSAYPTDSSSSWIWCGRTGSW